MKIIDCFTFYNELDLLMYRLSILYEFVDYFILVESTHTHAGHVKELYFNNNKNLYEKYLDKIIHIVVNDFKYLHPTIKYQKNEQWKNEKYQRNKIEDGFLKIKDLSDQDVIVLCDLDEIPDPKLYKNIKEGHIKINDISLIEMDLYYYNLNCLHHTKWYHPKIFTYKNYKKSGLSLSKIRGTHFSSCLRKSGWHLSYFGNNEFISNKLKQFSHQEFNSDKYTNLDSINKKINNCENLFDNKILNHVKIKDNKYLPPINEHILKFIDE